MIDFAVFASRGKITPTVVKVVRATTPSRGAPRRGPRSSLAVITVRRGLGVAPMGAGTYYFGPSASGAAVQGFREKLNGSASDTAGNVSSTEIIIVHAATSSWFHRGGLGGGRRSQRSCRCRGPLTVVVSVFACPLAAIPAGVLQREPPIGATAIQQVREDTNTLTHGTVAGDVLTAVVNLWIAAAPDGCRGGVCCGT